MRVENRMGEEMRRALELERQRFAHVSLDLRIGQAAAEGAPHRLDGLGRGRFVQRDPQAGPADAEIDLLGQRPRHDLVAPRPDINGYRIEERLAARRKAELAQTCGEYGGTTMHGAR